MQKFNLIVTCKGRLMHLKQTLPLFCALPGTEVTVADYGCPDRCGDWVEAHFPGVKVVRIDDDPGFNLSRARNIAAREAAADYLFFADADILIDPAAMDEINAVLTPETYVTIDVDGRGDGMRGTCIVPRQKFAAVGGYDELLKHYGMEDTELYARLTDFGCKDAFITPAAFTEIAHDDALRTTFFPAKSMRKLRLVAQFYQEYVKVFRRSLKVPQLALEDREQIHAAAVSLVDQLTAAADPRNGARIGLKLPVTRPEDKVGGDMDWQFELTMTMKPKDPLAFRQKYQNPLLYRK
ncbi:glycosyltransferase family 2 protein [Aestuariivirga sp.]|uniref:glycosyltransferase family 2 protein n=1 Tax=Aestuariivirga sp. TaxID=2650926 RepID=UPI0035ADC49B